VVVLFCWFLSERTRERESEKRDRQRERETRKVEGEEQGERELAKERKKKDCLLGVGHDDKSVGGTSDDGTPQVIGSTSNDALIKKTCIWFSMHGISYDHNMSSWI
jgi:hypothetical protein